MICQESFKRSRHRRRINAKKKFCANDVIPTYEAHYKRILSES
jgi:hypothetical protein